MRIPVVRLSVGALLGLTASCAPPPPEAAVPPPASAVAIAEPAPLVAPVAACARRCIRAAVAVAGRQPPAARGRICAGAGSVVADAGAAVAGRASDAEQFQLRADPYPGGARRRSRSARSPIPPPPPNSSCRRTEPALFRPRPALTSAGAANWWPARRSRRRPGNDRRTVDGMEPGLYRTGPVSRCVSCWRRPRPPPPSRNAPAPLVPSRTRAAS